MPENVDKLSTKTISKETKTEQEIPTTEIYKLEELKKYSKDFIRVLLPKPKYRPSDAVRIIKNYFKE